MIEVRLNHGNMVLVSITAEYVSEFSAAESTISCSWYLSHLICIGEIMDITSQSLLLLPDNYSSTDSCPLTYGLLLLKPLPDY